MSYEFPDTERALVEVLGETATLWLPADFGDNLPMRHVYSVGGRDEGVLRTDRLVVDVYAVGRSAAKAGAEEVRSILTDGPHFTTEGLLDRITVEVGPHLLPYASERIVRYTATYRVDVRPV